MMPPTNSTNAEQFSDLIGQHLDNNSGTLASALSADAPLGEGGQRALQAEREARKHAERSVATLQAQLDALNASRASDLDKAHKATTDAQAHAQQSTLDALRYRQAIRFGISDEDAALLLTGTDEATIQAQAEQLAAKQTRPEIVRPHEPRDDSTAQRFAGYIQEHLNQTGLDKLQH